MPLPFSFATQRQPSGADFPSEAPGVSAAEKIMSHAPVHVHTEPLLGTPGNVFSPPVLDTEPPASRTQLSLTQGQPHPSLSLNQSLLGYQTAITTQLPQAMQPQFHGGSDWSTQMEQLRNDFFGLAMNVSALSDRLDRLEQRMPAIGPSLQAGLASLRGEIETWLEKHLNAAVEHCVKNILSRPSQPASEFIN